MRFIISLLIAGLFVSSSFSQSTLPDSHVNIGFGFGMNYGTIGTKAVFGHKNSGLMVGVGIVPGGLFGYEVGAQLSENWLYLNLGYGVCGTQKIDDSKRKVIEAGDFMVGVMIPLDPEKRVFLDLGLGHTFGAPSRKDAMGYNISQNTVTGVVGIGFRLEKNSNSSSNSTRASELSKFNNGI